MTCTSHCGREVAEKEAKAKESLKHTMLYIQQQQRDRVKHDADMLQVDLPPLPSASIHIASSSRSPCFCSTKDAACHCIARARTERSAKV